MINYSLVIKFLSDSIGGLSSIGRIKGETSRCGRKKENAGGRSEPIVLARRARRMRSS